MCVVKWGLGGGGGAGAYTCILITLTVTRDSLLYVQPREMSMYTFSLSDFLLCLRCLCVFQVFVFYGDQRGFANYTFLGLFLAHYVQR